MKKTLGPVVHYDAYTDAIQREVIGYFQDVLIDPIEERLNERRENASSDGLKAALASGAVWYADGAFRGTFNAELSAALSGMGAKWNKRSSAFYVAITSIPLAVRQSIYEAKHKTAEKVAAIAALILLMRSNVAESDTGINTLTAQKLILDSADAEFNKALKEFDESKNPLGIPSKMKTVADEINEALREDAKRIMDEELAKLADELKTLASTDAPIDALKKTIERAKKRIAFRARGMSEHAAALLLSQYRREQAMRLGLRSYIWKTKCDNRVRPDHRLLEGKEFTWDSPPITNQTTGERNAPGEDYFCRCVPINLIPTATINK